MFAFNNALARMFDLFYTPFRSFHPVWGLLAMSAVTGLILLFIWKYTTNQKQMKAVKDRIKMHFIEIRLYQDDMGIIWKTQARILKQNLRYIVLVLVPALVIIVPVVFILVDMDHRFGREALEPGESALVKVKFAGRGGLPEVTIRAPEGVVVETPRLRIPVEREVDWRIRAEREGDFDLAFVVDGDTYTKRLTVGNSTRRFSFIKGQATVEEAFFNPGEDPLPKGSLIESIEITYPEMRFRFESWVGHWLTLFCVFSLAVGFGLKPVFNVE
ncbi:MAG: hypothetical protein KAW17_10305 [Candidatus Eisenbacteria sp.]|nr:hypothetical protein [Candidatus Eisenbacteria bacterium]